MPNKSGIVIPAPNGCHCCGGDGQMGSSSCGVCGGSGQCGCH